MIKKMYNLTINEIVKASKKKSMLIISVIIFIISFASPFLLKYIEKSASGFEGFAYSMNVDQINGTISSINANTNCGKVKKEFLEANKAKFQLLENNNITNTDWRYNEADLYYNSLLKEDSLKFLKEGISLELILGELPEDANVQGIKSALETSSNNLNNEIDKTTEETAHIKDMIVKNDYLSYLDSKIKNTNTSIDSMNKELVNLNKEYSKNKDNNLLKENIDALNINLSKAKNDLKIDKYRYDNKIPYDINNWKSNTLNLISMQSGVLLNKKLTKDKYMLHPIKGISYEKYEKMYNKNKTSAENTIKESWYSLKHNIPNPNVKIGGRNLLSSSLPVVIVLVTILGAILAGSVVSKEFSTGSIRLLLIRPVSRFKVLISKLLGVIIISYIILFISTICSLLGSGISGGFSDFTNGVVKVSSGDIVVHNYFGQMIAHLLFISISLLFIICVAFILSTITRSTAISVAISIILFIGSFIIVLIGFSHGYYVISETPLPYINLAIVSLLTHLYPQAMLNNLSGGIELIVVSIILIIISVMVFKSKDITN